MRFAILAALAAAAPGLAAAAPGLAAAAPADALHRTVAPMMRADGEVCDLLRAELGDTCTRVAHDGSAAVYQSRSRAGGRAGIRRLVLAIDTGTTVLVSPAVDLLDDQLASARPTLRTIAIDGKPGVMLDVVSTWKRDTADEHAQSLVGCGQVDGTAPPSGGAAGRGQAPPVDGTAPPSGGAAGRGQAPPVDGIWKCSLVDAGACAASVAADGRVTTSCGSSSTLSIAPRS
jgi:hypothetical protein